MAEVKRYAPERIHESLGFGTSGIRPADMDESPRGLYVLHSDYTALEREVERLRKVEVAALAMIDAGLADIDDAERAYDALAEACGRNG